MSASSRAHLADASPRFPGRDGGGLFKENELSVLLQLYLGILKKYTFAGSNELGKCKDHTYDTQLPARTPEQKKIFETFNKQSLMILPKRNTGLTFSNDEFSAMLQIYLGVYRKYA